MSENTGCQCKDACCGAEADSDFDINDLLADYRVAYDAVTPDIERLEAVIKHLKEPMKYIECLIKEHVVKAQSSVEGHGVKVTYRRGYERARWNGKVLDGYAAAHPEVNEFKTVTKVGPKAAIEVDEKYYVAAANK